MSTLNKSAELKALNDLLYHLRIRANAEKQVAELKALIRDTPSKPYDNTFGSQLSTDNYDKEASKYVQKKQEKRRKLLRPYWIGAVAIFAVLIVVWLLISGAFSKSTYLHTPEIVQKYTGMYYTSNGDLVQATLEITSCNESGALEGFFEFSKKQSHVSSKDVYGKYAIQGNVTAKSREGYITAQIKHSKWITQPSGYSPLKDMEIKIYENGQLLRGFAYNMSLCADGYEKTPVTELETPEILKTYTGTYKPYTTYNAQGTATYTFETCDAAGNVTGVFDYYINNRHGQCTLYGEITQKYSDGSVKLTLRAKDWVVGPPDNFYPQGAWEVEIYDDFRSFDCKTYNTNWVYEDEGFAEAPDQVNTPQKTLADKTKRFVFPVYPIIAIALGLLLRFWKIEFFTAEERKKLEELRQLDRRNKEENEKKNAEGLAKAMQTRQRQMADYKRQLLSAESSYENADQKVAQASILSANDKTLRNVEFLVEKIQSGRADSLKEALLLLDDYRYREQESWLRAENARLESQRLAKMEADLAWHNLNVEYEQRRQSNELEKIRKALED